MNNYPLEKYTYEIIGACMEVHKALGYGFLEAVYQEAIELEFKARGIPYEKEKELTINFKETILEKKYRVDFICYGEVILEIKALSQLTGEHEGQLINYLKATGTKVGLLINFGEKSLKYKRLIF